MAQLHYISIHPSIHPSIQCLFFCSYTFLSNNIIALTHRSRATDHLRLLSYWCHAYTPAYRPQFRWNEKKTCTLQNITVTHPRGLVMLFSCIVQCRPLSRRLDRCDRVIQNESRDPFGGNVYYVTMQITFITRKFRNGERNLHCDVVHITTKWVSSLTLDCNGVFAIKAYSVTLMTLK